MQKMSSHMIWTIAVCVAIICFTFAFFGFMFPDDYGIFIIGLFVGLGALYAAYRKTKKKIVNKPCVSKEELSPEEVKLAEAKIIVDFFIEKALETAGILILILFLYSLLFLKMPFMKAIYNIYEYVYELWFVFPIFGIVNALFTSPDELNITMGRLFYSFFIVIGSFFRKIK